MLLMFIMECIRDVSTADELNADDSARTNDYFLESSRKCSTNQQKHVILNDLDTAVLHWYHSKWRASNSQIPADGEHIVHYAQRVLKRLSRYCTLQTDKWLSYLHLKYELPPTGRSADTAATDLVVKRTVADIIQKNELENCQVYSASLIEITTNIQLPQSRKLQHLAYDKVNVMLCANSDGEHKLKPVVIGLENAAHTLEGRTHDIPVSFYMSSGPSLALTPRLLTHWFHTVFVPEVRKHHSMSGHLNREKAVLLLHNVPSDWSEFSLSSSDDRIECISLRPATRPSLQAMKGVAVACRRLYKHVESFMCYNSSQSVSIGSVRHTARIQKAYTLLDFVETFSKCWQHIPPTMIALHWKDILDEVAPTEQLEDIVYDDADVRSESEQESPLVTEDDDDDDDEDFSSFFTEIIEKFPKVTPASAQRKYKSAERTISEYNYLINRPK